MSLAGLLWPGDEAPSPTEAEGTDPAAGGAEAGPSNLAVPAAKEPSKAASLARTAIVLLAIGAFASRALDTAAVYNHTVDEPTQIASGLELLQFGTFQLHLDVPPLAKLAMAAPVFLEGARLESPPRRGHLEDATDFLYSGGRYWRTLRTARAMSTLMGVGVLLLVREIATHLFGPWPGVVALVVASVSPGLVTAASIANSDILGVLTMLWALVAWRSLLLRGGGWKPAAWFALALSAAILAKLSALPFLAFSLPVMTVWMLGREAIEPFSAPVRWLRAHGRDVLLVAMFVPVLLWAAFGLKCAAPVGAEEAQRMGAEIETHSQALAEQIQELASTKLPLGSFLRGMGVASTIARRGHPAYLMGQHSLHGWPQYFLTTLALKVPVGILAAVLLALGLAVSKRATPPAREVLLLALLAAAILASVARAGVAAGHRHIVVVEALFALVAAGGVALALADAGRRRAVLLGVFSVCLGAGAVSSLRAHPDALGYTNAFAGAEPDWWFADSNLDWGQDLERLGTWLKERGVDEPIHLAYFGTAYPERHGIRFVPLAPGEAASGWVAVSVQYERGMYGSGIGNFGTKLEQNGFDWLLRLKPETMIGTSIRVYHVPSTPPLSPLSEQTGKG